MLKSVFGDFASEFQRYRSMHYLATVTNIWKYADTTRIEWATTELLYSEKNAWFSKKKKKKKKKRGRALSSDKGSNTRRR